MDPNITFKLKAFKKHLALAILYADGTRLTKLEMCMFNDYLTATLCKAGEENVDFSVLIRMIDVCDQARESIFAVTDKMSDNIWEALCFVPADVRIQIHDEVLAYEAEETVVHNVG